MLLLGRGGNIRHWAGPTAARASSRRKYGHYPRAILPSTRIPRWTQLRLPGPASKRSSQRRVHTSPDLHRIRCYSGDAASSSVRTSRTVASIDVASISNSSSSSAAKFPACVRALTMLEDGQKPLVHSDQGFQLNIRSFGVHPSRVWGPVGRALSSGRTYFGRRSQPT